MSHPKAKLTVFGRQLIVDRVVGQGALAWLRLVGLLAHELWACIM